MAKKKNRGNKNAGKSEETGAADESQVTNTETNDETVAEGTLTENIEDKVEETKENEEIVPESEVKVEEKVEEEAPKEEPVEEAKEVTDEVVEKVEEKEVVEEPEHKLEHKVQEPIEEIKENDPVEEIPARVEEKEETHPVETEHKEETHPVETEHKEETHPVETEHKEETHPVETEHKEETHLVETEDKEEIHPVETETVPEPEIKHEIKNEKEKEDAPEIEKAEIVEHTLEHKVEPVSEIHPKVKTEAPEHLEIKNEMAHLEKEPEVKVEEIAVNKLNEIYSNPPIIEKLEEKINLEVKPEEPIQVSPVDIPAASNSPRRVSDAGVSSIPTDTLKEIAKVIENQTVQSVSAPFEVEKESKVSAEVNPPTILPTKEQETTQPESKINIQEEKVKQDRGSLIQSKFESIISL